MAKIFLHSILAQNLLGLSENRGWEEDDFRLSNIVIYHYCHCKSMIDGQWMNKVDDYQTREGIRVFRQRRGKNTWKKDCSYAFWDGKKSIILVKLESSFK